MVPPAAQSLLVTYNQHWKANMDALIPKEKEGGEGLKTVADNCSVVSQLVGFDWAIVQRHSGNITDSEELA